MTRDETRRDKMRRNNEIKLNKRSKTMETRRDETR